jgi:hypothetical protein
MSGATNKLADATRHLSTRLDPVGGKAGLYGEMNETSWEGLKKDVTTGTKSNPLYRMNAKADPLGNKLGFFGDDAPTPWDPVGRKMNLYGITVNPSQDWGQYSYGAEQAAPGYGAQNYARAEAVAQANMAKRKASTSRVLFGQ